MAQTESTFPPAVKEQQWGSVLSSYSLISYITLIQMLCVTPTWLHLFALPPSPLVLSIRIKITFNYPVVYMFAPTGQHADSQERALVEQFYEMLGTRVCWFLYWFWVFSVGSLWHKWWPEWEGGKSGHQNHPQSPTGSRCFLNSFSLFSFLFISHPTSFLIRIYSL